MPTELALCISISWRDDGMSEDFLRNGQKTLFRFLNQGLTNSTTHAELGNDPSNRSKSSGPTGVVKSKWMMAAAVFLTASPALAADLTPAVKAAPANFWDTFAVSGDIDAGITGNSVTPPDGVNFGHLFTDRANTPVFNQLVITAQRPIDPKSNGYDFGFKFQGLFGTDARYTHFLGELDYIVPNREQFDIVEANLQAHLPWLTSGGIDIKLGQYVTLLGAEVIPAPDNYLYSHSYWFNYGPFKHTGFLSTTHVNDILDIYAGIDSGVNTTLGRGDNNSAPAFLGGLGFNLLDGALTILATTHIGPENADTPLVRAACNCSPNSALRYYNDLTATWKVTDKLTLITDGSFVRDDGFHANGGGVAQYLVYSINDWLKIVGRAEIWRDANSFFVGAFPANFDAVNAQYGFFNTSYTGGRTTYGAITVGLNISPEIPQITPIKAVIFRPEVRFDSSLNGTTPFRTGTENSQFTFGGDVIIKF
jgi:hypothetical protein